MSKFEIGSNAMIFSFVATPPHPALSPADAGAREKFFT